MGRRERRGCAGAVLGAMLALAAPDAHAVLPDEIQVYDDALNAPHETSLELHLNTTPDGRTVPAYPGETVAAHGARATAEFALGLTPALEAGLYLPTVYDPDHGYALAGLKLRLKWMPVRHEQTGGLYAGVNFELGHVARRFEQATENLEVRTIFGSTTAHWLLALNPTFEVPLNPGARGGAPDLQWQMRALRRCSPETALGLEYYGDLGRIARFLPADQMQHTVYAVVETALPRKVDLHVGVGYGWAGADRLTLKAIVGVPF